MLFQKRKNLQNTSTSELQQRLESIWYEGSPGQQWLYPLEAIYRVVATLDRCFKQRYVVEQPIPVIVVGNITVGGTGKTPLVVYLSELLKREGYSPGIITRGYGGKATQWPVLVGADSDPTYLGDEPVLMAQRTCSPVVAGPDRNQDIEYLLAGNGVGINIVISDDGLQHYRLQRDIEIAVIDHSRGLGNQHCLPAGPLRESASRLDDCDFVVVNEVEPAAEYSMQLKAQSVCHLNSAIQQPLSDWKGIRVHAVTGIGNPQRFFQLLKNTGIEVVEHSFPDHYLFKREDILFDDYLPVIMTEKDAVKCRRFVADNHWYIPVSAELNKRFNEGLLKKLADVATKKSLKNNIL